MIQSQPSASRPRNSRVPAPVAPRRQHAVRSRAASRPELDAAGRWKVQLDLAPAEIAFVFRQGLARGAEVCQRGSHEWRPLVTTPELRTLLALRSSSPELLALFSDRRAPQTAKSAPPPPPPLIEPVTVPTHALPLVNRDSVPDWEDTPVLPLRIEPPVPRARAVLIAAAAARDSVVTPNADVTPSAFVTSNPAVIHARPFELSLVATLAVICTLAVTALTLRAEVPKLNALYSASRAARPTAAVAVPSAPAPVPAASPAAPSTIPVVFWGDLPVEGGKSVGMANAGRVTSNGKALGSAGSSGPDRASLARALGGAARAARSCGSGPVSAQVVVTFAPSGVARSIRFAVPPPVGMRSCVLNAVARARVAPWAGGETVTVSKMLRW